MSTSARVAPAFFNLTNTSTSWLVGRWGLGFPGVTHPVVVGGVGVLVTGDDLGGHPVRRPDEGVPPPHRPVQLGAHAEIHWGDRKCPSGYCGFITATLLMREKTCWANQKAAFQNSLPRINR